MKVLHVYRTYFPDSPGGLQEAIRQICISSKNYGVEARLFVLSPSMVQKEMRLQEAFVVRARSWLAPASCDIGLASAFFRFHRQLQWADLVHYHFPWPFADMLHLLMRPSCPSVMTYHSDVIQKGCLEKLYQPLMKHMLGAMDAIVATSKAYIDTSAVLRCRVSQGCLGVIPLCIQESSYHEYFAEAKGIDISDRFGVRDGQFFLFVGVMRNYKGLQFLIRAAVDTGLPLVVAGSGGNEARFTEMAAGHRNVRFVGRVSDGEKMALISRCRAMVLPSHLRSEAFGMVLVEAAMCGRPMISCEIGTGTSFVNKDGETGFVVKPASAPALAAAMRRLWDDHALAERFGEAARRRYERLFSGQAMGRAYARLYRRLLDGKQAFDER